MLEFGAFVSSFRIFFSSAPFSPYLALVHPIAFQLGTFTITWYGIMVASGFLAGLWTAGRRAMLQGVSPEKVYDLGLSLMVGSILGARTLYVITFWNQEFADDFSKVFKIWEGGLVYYGGLIGASLAVIIYTRIKKLPLWKMADVLAPSVALGYAFGRIGCLMNGCCYGRACSLPWAIKFPASNKGGAPVGVPLHPTEIYESLLSLCLYAFLAWLYRRKKFDGQIFATYLVCYAFLRSFVELFRGDYPNYQRFLGVVTPAQMVSIGILVAGSVLFVVLRRTLKGAQSKS
jgi:phosphatidylglycerol:prolipoprotein diacylglycerol transferase